MPKDAFSRLLDDDDDDLAPLTSLPSWEAHTASGWHYIENERGRAVVLIEGDRGCGMVRYADKVMVPIAWAPVKKLFEQVESILRDRPTGWDRLSTDILGDEAAPEAPKGVVPTVDEPRTKPTRTGKFDPFNWKFR